MLSPDQLHLSGTAEACPDEVLHRARDRIRTGDVRLGNEDETTDLLWR